MALMAFALLSGLVALDGVLLGRALHAELPSFPLGLHVHHRLKGQDSPRVCHQAHAQDL